MKIKKHLYIFLIFFFLMISLYLTDALEKKMEENGFKLYIFNKGTNYNDLTDNKVRLPLEPLLTENDIKSYDWQNHEIILHEESWSKIHKILKEMESNKIFKLLFTITIDNNSVYYGHIWKKKYDERDSFIPTIKIDDLKNNHFIINASSFLKNYNGNNIINNSELYVYLKKNNLLLDKKIKFTNEEKFKYKPVQNTYHMLPTAGRLQLIYNIVDYNEDIYAISIYDAKKEKIIYENVDSLTLNYNILFFTKNKNKITIKLYDLDNLRSDEYLIITIEDNNFNN